MPDLKDLEIGAMFWAGRTRWRRLREVKSLGRIVRAAWRAWDMPLEGAEEAWSAALKQEDFTIVTVFCAYIGESYADIPTVEQTVGFVPKDTRAEREQRTKDVSHFAAGIGVKSIACHVGFVPEDQDDPEYIAVRDMVRRICDHAALARADIRARDRTGARGVRSWNS